MNILTTDYMKKFVCIGPPCEDNCCIGWDVDIDEESYHKYKKYEDEPLKTLIYDFISINKSCYDKDVNYATVALTQTRQCPFLDSDRLCKIQFIKGERELSNVCSQYPRIYNRVNGHLELSASISCPEIAQFVLLEPDGVTFDTFPFEASRKVMISYDVNTRHKDYKNTPVSEMQRIRWLCMDIIQKSHVSNEKKFIELGRFIKAIINCDENQKLKKTLELQKKTSEFNDFKGFDDYFLNGDLTKGQIRLFKVLVEILDPENTVISKTYMDFFKKSEGVYASKALHEINELKERYYSGYFKKREYIWNNYFINHMFKSLFPFTEAEWIFDAYLLMLFRYIFMKIQLVGIAISNKGLTDDVVISYFQSFSKVIEHHKSFMLDTTSWCRMKNINGMKELSKIL